MTTKTATISQVQSKTDVKRLVKAMTIMAWTVLIIGTVLCLINLGHFSDQNVGLMVGLGFLVGSVHIYVIRTAIDLVHTKMGTHKPEQGSDNQ